MLRLAVIALLLANAGYYAYTQGWLRSAGLVTPEQAEPQRLQQQIRPETLKVLRAQGATNNPTPPPAPAAAPAADTAASTPAPTAAAPADAGECLQAGIFDEKQATALRTAAASLPQGSWTLEPTPITGRWMIYMGRFDDQETLDKKRAELRARKVDFDRAGGTLELGLSLGRFSTEEAAQRGLTTLNAQGVRTARVVLERQAAPGFVLKLPAVTDAQRQQWLATLRPAMAGKTLGSCS
ncbi:SPOR domain-containing protein [Acidovorax temperans]|uniref:SPOR domain-containing protein n=1 Tax=Acidovorax temperans TaxID=80878 RepID=UPI001A948577|nr:SPOR domain-containing protein [Acidovorax temperans]MBO0942277.1 SPOR domain-containing protein [Acidovorax temperans]